MRYCSIGILFAASLHGAVINYVIGYGQSLSLGSNGTPAISTTQPYANVSQSGSNFIPLIETSQESPNSAAANNTTLLDPAHTYALLMDNRGSGGQNCTNLSKGTSPYNSLIAGVSSANTIAVNAGNMLVVRGILFTHGEADFGAASTVYAACIVQMQIDLDTDIKAITNQSQNVVFFLSQVSSIMQNVTVCTPGAAGTICGVVYTCPDGTAACLDDYTGVASPMTTIAQWRLQHDYPTLFRLTGPKFQMTYADSVHLVNTSYNYLGATASRLLKGYLVDATSATYGAVMPHTISRVGATVTVTFYTPNSLSLTCDHSTIGNPIRNGVTDTVGCGFQFFQVGSSLTDTFNNGGITGVSCSGQTCTITLSGTPAGTNQRIASAFEGTRNANSGAAGNTQSNIRTVADYTDINGDVVYHWAIHFNEAVGYVWSPFGSPAATKFLISQ